MLSCAISVGREAVLDVLDVTFPLFDYLVSEAELMLVQMFPGLVRRVVCSKLGLSVCV